MIYFSILRKLSSDLYNLKFIKAQLIKYSIIFLLKPEWLAKAERCFNIFENHKYIYTVSQQLNILNKRENKNQREYKLDIECSFNYRNNQSTSLVKKISGDEIISRTIYIWLSNQNFISEDYEYCKNIIFTNRFNDLFKVIYSIGLEWYIYTNLQIGQLYQELYLTNHNRQKWYLSKSQVIDSFFISFSQYSYKHCINLREAKFYIYYPCSKKFQVEDFCIQTKIEEHDLKWLSYRIIKNISYVIRSNLYHKNRFGIWRINNQLTHYKAKFLIKKVIYLWYIYYWYMISLLDRKLINFTINKMFYLWQRKKDNR